MIAPRLSRGLCLLVGLGLLAGACSHKSAATKTPPQSPPAESVSPTVTSPTSPDQVQTTTRQVYQASRVVLSSTNLTFLGLASYDCSYAPPPEVLPVPLQAVTVPVQTWSGAQCSGSLQLTVQGPETATAAGQ